MELHGVGILIVFQRDDGLGAPIYGFCFHTFIIKVGGHVAIGMCDGHSGLEIIFATRSGIDLMTSCAHCTIGGSVGVPLKVVVVGCILQFVAIVYLVKAAFRRNLQHEIGILCAYAHGLCVHAHCGQ